MTRQVPVHPPPRPRERRCLREFAGGTTAECAAVCCCCPCAVINLLVVAVYKVPRGLCRKAVHKKKQRNSSKKKQNDGLLQQRSGDAASSENIRPLLEDPLLMEIKKEDSGGVEAEKVENRGVLETSDLEREMLAHFNGTGFWWSSSRRVEEVEVER